MSPTETGVGAIKSLALRGLGLKLFLAIVLVVALILGGALALIQWRANQAADAAIDRQLAATQSAIEDALASRSQAMQQVGRVLAQVPNYLSRIDEALRSGARDNIFDQAGEFRDQAGAAWAIITDKNGVVQATTRSATTYGDTLGGPLVESALAGENASGIWIETTERIDSLFQVVSVPLGANPVSGALILALRVDDAFAERLKRQTASEVVFSIFDTLGKPQSIPATTIPAATIDSALRARYADLPGAIDSVLPRLRVEAAGQTWIAAAGPLRTASGVLVGEYAGLRARQAELAPFAALQRSVLYSFFGALAVALVISLLLARQITGPLRRLVGITREVAEGRYSGEVDIRSRDEIGELAVAFQGMLSELREKQVYGFARQSEGHVAITSDVGKGTTVRLYLPWIEWADFVVLQDVEVVGSNGVGHTKILIVEDDDELRELATQLAEGLGYVTCSASTGAEAIAAVERDPRIGLLFTDILMPGGMSGYDLAAEVRRRRPGMAVLVTSGFPGNFLPGACDDFDIIRKPFTQTELAAAFLKVQAHSSQQDRLR